MQGALELAKVRQTVEAWLTAFNTKDTDALLSLYDPESIYANATAPLMRGIDQIRPWFEQAFSEFNEMLLYKEEAAFQDGNLALLIGAYFFKPPKGSTPPLDMYSTGRVSLVYRRDQNNDWKLLFHMDNTPPDVTPADFM